MRPFLNLATIKSPHVQAADCHFRVAPLSEHTHTCTNTHRHIWTNYLGRCSNYMSTGKNHSNKSGGSCRSSGEERL